MKLDDLEFRRLLPVWMDEDLAVRGLSKGVEALVAPIVDGLSGLSLFDAIDVLPEWVLDELAWELNLIWYEKDASLLTKRDLVKNGIKVWSKLGTKWAVENVVTAYFGEGYMKEWFEYEGEPGHFSIYSSNPTVTNEKLQMFMWLLERIKRHSAKLDNIYITLSGEMPLAAGMGVREVAYETYAIGNVM